MAAGGGGAGGASCDVDIIYDPLAGGVDIFPDDFFTVEVATLTGLRVSMASASAG